MGFPNNVKEEALVASGRRCCVCTKFKSVEIEVHHIIQKADGGADDFDNAIPLCMECHSRAGHYNPRHPKGSKFSPSELRKHRDNHYAFIKNNRILDDDSAVSQFYLKTENLDVIGELFAGDLSQFPYEGAKLVNNNVLAYMQYYYEMAHSENKGELPIQQYSSFEEYKGLFGNKLIEKEEWGQKYYSRILDDAEIRTSVAPFSAITQQIVAYGGHDLILARFNEYGCGDESNYERYEIPEVSFVFCAIQNNCNAPISISEYNVCIPKNRISGFELSDVVKTIQLPNLDIEPGELLLIPIGLYMKHLELRGKSKSMVDFHTVKSGESQYMDLCDDDLGDNGLYIGELSFIKSIQVKNAGLKQEQSVRSPIFSQAIRIDRSWMCGSCPHIFGINKGGGKEYFGELFGNGPNEDQLFEIAIPFNIIKLEICELEEELTHIKSMEVNGLDYGEAYLKKDERIEIDVEFGDNVKIRGCYTLVPDTLYENNKRIKMQRILRELSKCLS